MAGCERPSGKPQGFVAKHRRARYCQPRVTAGRIAAPRPAGRAMASGRHREETAYPVGLAGLHIIQKAIGLAHRGEGIEAGFQHQLQRRQPCLGGFCIRRRAMQAGYAPPARCQPSSSPHPAGAGDPGAAYLSPAGQVAAGHQPGGFCAGRCLTGGMARAASGVAAGVPGRRPTGLGQLPSRLSASMHFGQLHGQGHHLGWKRPLDNGPAMRANWASRWL